MQAGVRSGPQAGREGRPASTSKSASTTAWAAGRTRKPVTTELLGKAVIPNLPYEQPDGTPIRIDTDYFGKPRNESPTPGPFENPGQGELTSRCGERGRKRYTVLSTQCRVLSAQYSVLSTQCSVLSAQYTVLSTRCSVHGAQYSVHSTQC